ncbi:MAG: hypothetical protein LBQ61_01145 [Spirochaetales bacterium]|jgi:hypothetical protein|nr:hypothetical protein [Spirochaetales bacterium]
MAKEMTQNYYPLQDLLFRLGEPFRDLPALGRSALLALTAALLPLTEESILDFTLQDALRLMEDLPRHNSSQYINQESLTGDYFHAARRSLEDPFVYIVLSDTGSPASKLISLVTRRRYNHVSLAFDESLATMISYNGGGQSAKPGLNQERLFDLRQKETSSVAVYRLASSRRQKEAILSRVEKINREGSSYNLSGLITKKSSLPNIMFCSQFVYSMLNEAGLNYFYKESTKVHPMDFLELDAKNTLSFLCAYLIDKKPGLNQTAYV